MRNLRLHYRLLVIAALVLTGCRSIPGPDPVVPPMATVDTPMVITLPETGGVAVVEITRWRQDAAAAMSITFDDGTLDQYLLAAPALEAYGLPATFFLISGLIDGAIWNDYGTRRMLFGWDAARNLASRGHEIGSHTMTHPDLSVTHPIVVEHELARSREILQEQIPGLTVRSLAWPYWRSTAGTREIGSRHYLAARAGTANNSRYRETGIPSARPDNRMAVNALSPLPRNDPVSWINTAHEIIAQRGWGVLSLHGVDDGFINRAAVGWEPLPLHQLSGILEHLNDPLYWVAPFGTVVQYIDRRDQTVIELAGIDRNGFSLMVQGPHDDELLSEQITVALHLPTAWSEARVTVDGLKVETNTVGERRMLLLPTNARVITVSLLADSF